MEATKQVISDDATSVNGVFGVEEMIEAVGNSPLHSVNKKILKISVNYVIPIALIATKYIFQ